MPPTEEGLGDPPTRLRTILGQVTEYHEKKREKRKIREKREKERKREKREKN